MIFIVEYQWKRILVWEERNFFFSLLLKLISRFSFNRFYLYRYRILYIPFINLTSLHYNHLSLSHSLSLSLSIFLISISFFSLSFFSLCHSLSLSTSLFMSLPLSISLSHSSPLFIFLFLYPNLFLHLPTSFSCSSLFFQAILPLRGKILNIEKASTDKIYQNTELQSLIAAIGLGVRGA